MAARPAVPQTELVVLAAGPERAVEVIELRQKSEGLGGVGHGCPGWQYDRGSSRRASSPTHCPALFTMPMPVSTSVLESHFGMVGKVRCF
jgi:hypothetical protein